MPGPASSQNVEVPRGNSRVLRIPVLDDAGAPVDLTDASARWWVARSPTGAGVLIEKEISGGVEIDEDDGTYTLVITIDPDDTRRLAPGTYYHEAEVVDALDNVVTATTGTFTVTATIIPEGTRGALGPAAYDFDIVRGNTHSFLFRFKDGGDLFDLTGSEIVFRALARGQQLIRKTTGNDGMLMPTPTNGEVTLLITVAESRLLPLGKIASYEVERRISGGQRTLLKGKINATDGVNDDV